MNQTMYGKPPTRGIYLCTNCDNSFRFFTDVLKCPVCPDGTRDDLVIIFVRDQQEELLMHMPCDYNAG